MRLVRAKKSRLNESGSVPQAVELRSRTSIYDHTGKLIESSYYNSRGVLQNTISYKYDTAGREIATSEYDGRGSLIQRSVSIYDNNGRPKSPEVGDSQSRWEKDRGSVLSTRRQASRTD